MFAAASGASQRQPDNANPPPLNHAAFELADDDPNLEGALKMYQSCRWGCLDHMSQTLHPLEGFDWNLRSYQPFIDAFPSDAEALNRRWESFTALMTKEQLAALEDRSILNIADWDVLSQKSQGGVDEERARLRPVCAKILNKPKRNDVLRILRRIEGGERYCLVYTKEVHEQCKKLIAPLWQMVRDKMTDEAQAAVSQVGWELHKLGGMRAQMAVGFAMMALLEDEVPEGCTSVEGWLNGAWDGCGDWLA